MASNYGVVQKTNIDINQRFQNKILRSSINAPWYFRNSDLNRELKVETVN